MSGLEEPSAYIADALTLQRLGEKLGQGAFAAVYKGINWGTGEAVAIKQIKIADLPKSELRMIEVMYTRSTFEAKLMII